LPYDGARQIFVSAGRSDDFSRGEAVARILCVDDTPTELLFLEKILGAAGHEITSAPHVPAALELVEQDRFDLIISDYRMPKLTGLELLNILSRDGYEVPLIMSTAYGTIEDDEIMARDSDAQDGDAGDGDQ